MIKIKFNSKDGVQSFIEFDQTILENKTLIKDLLFGMYLARFFEQKAEALYAMGEIHGTMHLAIGQEASAIGTTAALSLADKILVSHRGHQELIGKGVDPYRMFCELLSRKDGVSQGFGGSMHMIDVSKGVLHANGIVAANTPLACGAALAIKRRHLNSIVSCYIGDGGMNEGAYFESLNLASLWQLPVVFVTVNNHYGMSTPVEKAHADPDFSKRGQAFSIPVLETDGNDVLLVYQAMREAKNIALRNQPVILILNTYRLSGHSRSDVNRYRSEEELEFWRKRCPIKNLQNRISTRKLFAEKELQQIRDKARQQIENAAQAALAAEPVKGELATNYIYTT